jgi:hypothetical protein
MTEAEYRKTKNYQDLDPAEQARALDLIRRNRGIVPGTEPGTAPRPSTDPYANLVNTAAGYIPEWVPGWARTAGTFVIPQTAPELAAMAAGSLVGMPWAGKAAPLVGKTLAKALASPLGRVALGAGLGGVGAGATGAMTGYDPLITGGLGALGAGGGQGLGYLANKVIQGATVRGMAASVTPQMATAWRKIFGLSDDMSDGEVISHVLRGHPVDAAENALGAFIKQNYTAEIPHDPRWDKLVPASALVPGKTPNTLQIGPLWHESGVRRFLLDQMPATLRDEAKDLMGDRTNAILARELMTGSKRPSANTIEQAGKRIKDPKTDDISVPGWAKLSDRFETLRPRLQRQLSAEEFSALEDALYRHDVPRDILPKPGKWPEVDISTLRLSPSTLRRIIPTMPSASGWERAATIPPNLATGAVEALSPQWGFDVMRDVMRYPGTTAPTGRIDERLGFASPAPENEMEVSLWAPGPTRSPEEESAT